MRAIVVLQYKFNAARKKRARVALCSECIFASEKDFDLGISNHQGGIRPRATTARALDLLHRMHWTVRAQAFANACNHQRTMCEGSENN